MLGVKICKMFVLWCLVLCTLMPGMHRLILYRGPADAPTSNTGDWIDGVVEPCRCPSRKHRPTVTSWIDKNGRRKVRGVLNVLAESAAYPRRMGQRIYACHTGQYIAHRRPATKSLRRLKTTAGKQPRASSARIAKTWLQPRASRFPRPTSRFPLSARATSVPKLRDWLHPGIDASSTKSSNVTRVWMQPSATGR